MSVEVKIPEEISDYKESIIAGLSVRQLVCGGMALLFAVPMFLALKNISQDLATYGAMIMAAPVFCVGFIKKDGYSFETFLKIRLYALFCRRYRTYEIDECSKAEGKSVENIEYEEEKKGNNRVTNKKRTKNECEFIGNTEKGIKRKTKTAYKKLKKTAKRY